MTEAYLVAARRTPVGRRGGGLAHIHPADLAAHVLRGLLDTVDVDIARGQFTAVMGPSGSGKSTLMHCLAGLDTLTEGQAWVGEVELSGLDDTRLTRLRRDSIGFVFQAFNLLPSLTVEQNVLLPMRLAGERPDRRRAAEVLGQVGLGDKGARRPAEPRLLPRVERERHVAQRRPLAVGVAVADAIEGEHRR